jgi:hypothetical protein
MFFRALGSEKFMKDFAEKQTAEQVRLISDIGPRILKIVVFGGRRRLLHPHSGFRARKLRNE